MQVVKLQPTSLHERIIPQKNSQTSIWERSYFPIHVLDKHKGKKILIDVWASWCRDCIVRLTKFENNYKKKIPEVSLMFFCL